MKLALRLQVLAIVALISSPTLAGNILSNGDFRFCQRGCSFINASAPTKVADRWWVNQQGAASNIFTVGAGTPTAAGGSGHYLRYQRPASSTTTGTIAIFQAVSSDESAAVIGGVATVTVWADGGANFSGSTYTLTLIGGTGIDQSGSSIGSWTGQTTLATRSCAVTIVVAACSVTTSAAIPTSIKQVAVLVQTSPSGTAGTDDSLTMRGIDLRAGATVPSVMSHEPWAVSWMRVASYYEELARPPTTPVVIGPALSSGLISANLMRLTVSVRFMPKRVENYSISVAAGATALHISDPVSGAVIYDLNVIDAGHKNKTSMFAEVTYTVNGSHPEIVKGAGSWLATDAVAGARFAIDCDL